MKKIKLLVVLPLILAFLLLGKTSFAQTPPATIPNNPLFDMTKPVATSFIQYGETSPKTINLFPFTTITVPPQSFNDNVNVYVFEGNWDKLKTILPKDQSPIASYYLVFINSKGKVVTPSNQISAQVYNNYVGTNTYFYPMGSVGNIDVANSKSFTGHILLNTQIPIQDSAFMVGINKIIAKNDSSLTPPTPGTYVPAKTTSSGPSLYTQKVFALIFLIIVAMLLLALLWSNSKKTSRRRK